MAKNSIRDYDATSGNNTDVQSVDISEGCAASGINNALREIMTDLKNVSTGAVALETPAADQLNVDNIRIDGNTISSTDTNGNVTIDPAGTGDTIIASGNLGIGDATPIALLTMVAADGVMADQYVAKFTNSEATTGQNYGVFVAGGSSSADESFGVRNFDSSATYFKVRGDGNVGIGTSSPSSLLTSEKDFGNNSGSSAVALQIGNISTVSGQTPGTRLLFNSGNRESGAIDVNHNTAGGDNASMNFVVRDGANTMTERMRITSGGTLAIATTSPESQAKLQANGPAIFIHNHTDTSSSGNVSYLAGNQALTLVNAQAGANNLTCKLGFSIPTTGANSDGLIEYGSTAAGSGEFRFYTESGNILANRMTITSGGEITYNNDPTSGGGVNVALSASYNDTSNHLVGGVNTQSFALITINTSNGATHIPVYRNGGAGVAFDGTMLDPDNKTWVALGASITFNQPGSFPQTFVVSITGGGSQLYVQRTSGSNAYSVFVQLLG